MKFSLAISHTPWVPERVKSLDRLFADLAPSPTEAQVFREKAPNDVWSLKMWEWAASQEVDCCLFLQDDAIVSPDFWEGLEYAADNGEYPIVGLHAPHPAALALAEEQCYRGFSTRDGLIGVGYCITRDVLRDFLTWRADNLERLTQEEVMAVDGRRLAVTEDTLLGLYAAATGYRVYHPMPALVDHDVEVPTTYAGNDHHPHRQSGFRWDHPLARDIVDGGVTPHLGRFYPFTANHLAAYTSTSREMVEDVQRDDGRYEKRRIQYSRLGRRHRPEYRLQVATPTRGEVSAGYCKSVWQLLRDDAIEITGDLEITDTQVWNSDVVRVRNRFAWHFLHNTDATHLLFLDSDIEVSPICIRGMLKADQGFVAAPYPRRGGIEWPAITRAAIDALTLPPGSPFPVLEAAAYKYSVLVIDGELKVNNEMMTAPVKAMPLGCALIRRAELQSLWNSVEETYEDRLDTGQEVKVKNLFGLLIDGGGLLSEDFSFCARWRQKIGSLYMYLGGGSPVNHIGAHNYQGQIEAFGLRRG